MKLLPKYTIDYPEWDYIMGTPDRSIAIQRWQHIWQLNNYNNRIFGESIKIAIRDPKTDLWTKWGTIYDFRHDTLLMAWDIHRQVMHNEIIVESDYPTYEENAEAARKAGAVMESKGFKVLYYYSGSKSVHAHSWFDFSSLCKADMKLQLNILDKYTRPIFIRKFIEYLRGLCVSSWGLKLADYDDQLIKGIHLIRCELSKNKIGYKTLIGTTYKDITSVPFICNERNHFYPKMSPMVLSSELDVNELLSGFLRQDKLRYLRKSTTTWNDVVQGNEELPYCLAFMMSPEFKANGDGFQRAAFILTNELKRRIGQEAAAKKLSGWNEFMGMPIRENELMYRLSREQNYRLNCEYVHTFLRNIGYHNIIEKCNGKT